MWDSCCGSRCKGLVGEGPESSTSLSRPRARLVPFRGSLARLLIVYFRDHGLLIVVFFRDHGARLVPFPRARSVPFRDHGARLVPFRDPGVD